MKNQISWFFNSQNSTVFLVSWDAFWSYKILSWFNRKIVNINYDLSRISYLNDGQSSKIGTRVFFMRTDNTNRKNNFLTFPLNVVKLKPLLIFCFSFNFRAILIEGTKYYALFLHVKIIAVLYEEKI